MEKLENGKKKKKELPLTNIVGKDAVNGKLKMILLQCLCK